MPHFTGKVNPMMFIPIVGLFAGGTEEGRFKTLTVSFEQDMVSNCRFVMRASKHGGATVFNAYDQESRSSSVPCESMNESSK